MGRDVDGMDGNGIEDGISSAIWLYPVVSTNKGSMGPHVYAQ